MRHHICAGGVVAVDDGLDLFQMTDRYPHQPAAQATDTSRQAAEAMKERAQSLQMLCLTALMEKPMTADEVATALKESVLAIRPRVTELHKLGKIADTGVRRTNISGHRAIVWGTVERGQAESGKGEATEANADD